MVTELRQSVDVDTNKSLYWKFTVISTTEITSEEDMDHTELAVAMETSGGWSRRNRLFRNTSKYPVWQNGMFFQWLKDAGTFMFSFILLEM
jgi:hypothetical protein